MKIKIVLNFACFIIFVFFTNCDKNKGFLNSNSQIQSDIPAIQIVSPTLTEIQSNTNLRINVNYSANSSLHMYGFWLRNKKSGTEFASFMKHYDGSKINLDTTIVSNWQSGDTLALQVYTINHSSQTNSVNQLIIVK